ncbi:hypothetical protein [Actinoplanes couchii]|uniref:Clp domain protein n=1 Tax=Actinoplanes couchii TaxID=403638 RepID=A0ABQ3X809_9ACTN|nr:hypothetical protein [Actinoplanes couchii]MDR6320333.1 hypothetical protein [Actinoplanes couchii]GID54653.1 hypothetical protein Aco03nite_030570 [Actinoplanes couchii]
MTGSEFDPGRLSQVVVSALDLAAAETGPARPVDTRDVLLALARVDMGGDWQRLWLAFDSPEVIARFPVRDPAPEPAADWGPAVLTAGCTRALAAAVRLADVYDTGEVPVGLAAIALTGEPDSAAATAVTFGDRSRHPELLELLQEVAVQAVLNDLPDALRHAFAGSPVLRAGDGDRELDAVVGRLGGPDSLNRVDAVALVGAAVEVTGEPTLVTHLERMELTRDVVGEARRMAGDQPSASAADMIQRARDRFDTTEPTAAQLIVAATTRPVPAVRRTAWLLGLSAEEIAYEAADADTRQRPHDDKVSDYTMALTVLLVVLNVVTSVLVVTRAVQHGPWWLLLFVLLIWSGHPRLPNWWAFLVALLLYPPAGLPVAAPALAGALAELALARSERRTAFFRTGVRLTARQWRRHVRRRHPRASQAGTTWIRLLRMRRMGVPVEES